MVKGKKTCCYFFNLKQGATILLILIFIGATANFFLYGVNIHYPGLVRLIYSIEFIIDITFIIIGMIGIYGRKPSWISAYGLFLLVKLFLSFIIFLDYILPMVKKDEKEAAGELIFGLALGAALQIYFVYIFFNYSHELENELRDEKEISAIIYG